MSWHGDPDWALHAAFLISVPSLSASKVLPGIYACADWGPGEMKLGPDTCRAYKDQISTQTCPSSDPCPSPT